MQAVLERRPLQLHESDEGGQVGRVPPSAKGQGLQRTGVVLTRDVVVVFVVAVVPP